MSTFLYILLAIIIIIVILGLIAPKTFNVNRSITIHKPLPEVFSIFKIY